MEAEITGLDQLQKAYKEAVEAWITTIREEEALASTEHTVAEIDEWEEAGFREEKSPRQGQSCQTAVRGRSSGEVLQLLAIIQRSLQAESSGRGDPAELPETLPDIGGPFAPSLPQC